MRTRSDEVSIHAVSPLPIFDGVNEDRAVADVSSLGGGRHDLGNFVHDAVGHHDLDLDLGGEVHRVLTTAIELGMALLPTEPAYLRDGHADNPDGGERLLDVVELERLDDGLDFFHLGSSRRVWSKQPHSRG